MGISFVTLKTLPTCEPPKSVQSSSLLHVVPFHCFDFHPSFVRKVRTIPGAITPYFGFAFTAASTWAKVEGPRLYTAVTLTTLLLTTLFTFSCLTPSGVSMSSVVVAGRPSLLPSMKGKTILVSGIIASIYELVFMNLK